MKKTDILYIHPFGEQVYSSGNYFMFDNDVELKDHNSSKYYSYIPMGLIGALNKLIAEGYTVRGINLPFKKAISGIDVESYLKDVSARIILIDMHWYVHLKNGIEVAKICKRLMPDVPVVVGGMTATIFTKQLIKLGCVDYVIMGDSEKPLNMLADHLLKGGKGKIPNLVSRNNVYPIKYCCADIDYYDYSDIHFMEDHWSYLRMLDFWLLIAKGCAHECEACDGNRRIYPSIYSRKKLIARDVLKVARDIKNLEGKTSIVALSHDLDMLGKKFWSDLLLFSFDIGVRNEFFQLPHFELIQKMADSFETLDLVFSPVAGSYKERKKHGKNFTNEDLLDLLIKVKQLDFNGGITVYFSDYMISQLKVERLDSMARESFINDIKKIDPYAVIEVQHQVVDPMAMIKKGLEPDRVFQSLI